MLLGMYLCVLTIDYVIQRSDYAQPLLFEQAQIRYSSAVILSLMIVFSLVGPFIAAASFGPWLRHAVYGLVGCIALVVGVALVGAGIKNEQPFNKLKSDGNGKTDCIDAARLYGIPVSFVIGPIAGILIGRQWIKQAETENQQ
tara:strand:- start:1052 stop:1480 length:429 start_codon:yes stop_codon:yes gene_type:complete